MKTSVYTPLNLTKGQLVWIKCPIRVWQEAEIKSNEGDVTIALIDDGEVILNKNMDIYIRNDNNSEDVYNLIHLPHLHEPAILHTLHNRFRNDVIYTQSGDILIAVNPFKELNNIYSDSTMLEVIKGVKHDPHVFQLANSAYRKLCNTRCSQSILVSGESGSGKTESTKLLMSFLTRVGSETSLKVCSESNLKPGSLENESNQLVKSKNLIENQVLLSNPVLEAFGNSKTLRNNNSSRFGKYIKMDFEYLSEGVHAILKGTEIQIYLLESVRVCHHQVGERNYHSFYQALAASKSADVNGTYTFPSMIKDASIEEISLDFSLISDPYQYYNYLLSSEPKSQELVLEFEEVISAMIGLGITSQEIQSIWLTLTIILSIGELKFSTDNKEAAELCNSSMELLICISKKLGTNVKFLMSSLSNRKIKMAKEEFLKPLNYSQAEETRDALAKCIYNLLFKRILQKINLSIADDQNGNLSIAVLDIFGFECFNINSFEQLCINFTNERLQKYFNECIFKNEERIYNEEKIKWSPIYFADNQDCLDLFELKRVGIFSILDEECIIPGGTDKGFCSKIKIKHQGNSRLNIIKTKQDSFLINHFAGPVEYCTTGFLDKNKDTLSEDIVSTIKATENLYFSQLFSNYINEHKQHKYTVSSEFRIQLNNLLTDISKTETHFIRCMKPNPLSKADLFQRDFVCEQLRYDGILQAIEASRTGFPIRLKHEVFMSKFASLAKDFNHHSRNSSCHLMELLSEHIESESYAVGLTKIFLKGEAYDLLTERIFHKEVVATIIQKHFRGWRTRLIFTAMKQSTLTLQRYIRSRAARQCFNKKNGATIRTQKKETAMIELTELLSEHHEKKLRDSPISSSNELEIGTHSFLTGNELLSRSNWNYLKMNFNNNILSEHESHKYTCPNENNTVSKQVFVDMQTKDLRIAELENDLAEMKKKNFMLENTITNLRSQLFPSDATDLLITPIQFQNEHEHYDVLIKKLKTYYCK